MSLLDTLLTDESARRDAFPVTTSRAFFAHAAVAPLPRAVVRAMSDYLTRCSAEGQFGHLHETTMNKARELAAELLDATPEEIAFVTSTSVGLSLVASGLPWAPGDNVLMCASDFPANVVPWLGLRERGIEVRLVPHHDERAPSVDDLAPLIDRRTRLVSLSTVHYLTGNAIDVDALGTFLHERGVLFCVDAIQSLGALPCSARSVDFLAAGAHKWLLGPQGVGILFVNRQRIETLRPTLLGWRSFAGASEAFVAGAQRYEAGTINAAGIVGVAAALSLLHEVGLQAISARLMSLRAMFLRGIASLGYRPLSPLGADEPACITSIAHPTADLSRVRARLEAHVPRVVLSERRDASGQRTLRFAPHFYNTAGEVEMLLELLA